MQVFIKIKSLKVTTMKKNIYLPILMFLPQWLFAQSDSLPKGFSYQQVLQNQLAKIGQSILQFPVSDPCERKGSPQIKSGMDGAIGTFAKGVNLEIKSGGIADELLPVDGNINIFWVHGLNGTTGSWRAAAQATQFGFGKDFPARKVRSVRGIPSSSSHAIQFYSEDGGLTAAAGDLENMCNSLVPKADRTWRDFIIAHSQGGMVSREWLRKMEQEPGSYQKFAHGLVTFGSPHAGAMILNNTRPEMGNMAEVFLKDACVSLGAPEVNELVAKNLAMRLLVSDHTKKTIIDNSCGFIASTILPLAIDNYFKRTTLDFYVNSPFLLGYNEPNGKHVQGLSEYELKVPVVQFYASEKQPVLWKYLSSVMEMGHDQLDNKQVVFGYNDDTQLEKKVVEMINQYQSGYEYWLDKEEMYEKRRIRYLASVVSPLSISSILLANAAQKNRDAAADVKAAHWKAKTWLLDANIGYNRSILGAEYQQVNLECNVIEELSCRDPRKNPEGSGKPAVHKVVTRVFYSKGPNCTIPSIANSYANYHFVGTDGTMWLGSCTGEQTVFKTWINMTYTAPNDGVVLTSSQSHKIRVNTDKDVRNTHFIVNMGESNHEQMKNDENTQRMLLNLYKGEYGPFFKVEIKL